MPRAKRVPSSPGRQLNESMWFAVAGKPLESALPDWDMNSQMFMQALLEIVASGASLFIRSGSSGQSLGIAIWEGDDRHPATWFMEWEEVDAWTKQVIETAEANRERKRAKNGA